MPELPEVETVVRELNRKLRNRTIKSVEVRAAKLVGMGPAGLGNIRKVKEDAAEQFQNVLKGKKILAVRRRAKLLIFDLQGPVSMHVHHPTSPSLRQGFARQARLRRTSAHMFLFVHLKMTGQFIFEDKSLRKKTGGKYRMLNKPTAPLVQLPGKHTHVIFTFTDGSTLYFNDLRKFAYLKLVRDDEVSQIKELGEYGPEPLSKEFNLFLFMTVVRKRNKSSIKQVLMDNRVVVGIGNIYSDEILFHAKVRPDRKVSTLKDAELKKIYEQIRPILKKGIAAKGSSVGDFVRTDGTWGSMGKFHFVYGRKRQPCKQCGTMIQSIKLGGRTSCYCPKCQT